MINPKLTSIICLSLALASCEAPENLDRSVAKNETKSSVGEANQSPIFDYGLKEYVVKREPEGSYNM
jgi:hypothetical protein